MKKYIERYWRKATREDTVKDKPLIARFRHVDVWKLGELHSWERESQSPWYDENGQGHDEAEVYDAPDPGEGYELIDPTTEQPGPGIEYLYGMKWMAAYDHLPLNHSTFYRRKIQPEAKAETVTFPGIRSLCRPLAKSEEITSADIFVNEKGQPERAYTAVGQFQSNADHKYYRELNPMPGPEELKLDAKTPESFGTTTELQIIAEKKPEAAEPVTFVAHPIQFNDKGECLFYGKVIQERSYAVLNEQGHYLMWRLGVGPVYVPEFRQAFTPTQLQQVSVRELGSNIRLRAVEPVDVDKLKQEYMQEMKEKLQPKVGVWEPKRQKVSWKGREYWVLTRFHVVKERGHDPTELAVLQDVTDRDGDQLRFVPSQHFDKPQPEVSQPVKEPIAPQPVKSLHQAYEDAVRLKLILSILDSFQPMTHTGLERKLWIKSAAMFLIGEAERCIDNNSVDLGKRVED